MGTPMGFNKILKTFEEQHQMYSSPPLKLFTETTGEIFNLTTAEEAASSPHSAVTAYTRLPQPQHQWQKQGNPSQLGPKARNPVHRLLGQNPRWEIN